jgi:hypothetical protein
VVIDMCGQLIGWLGATVDTEPACRIELGDLDLSLTVLPDPPDCITDGY